MGTIKNIMGFFKDCGCGCNGAKAQQKFLISLMSALVFFVIANPDTFRLTRSIFGSWISGPTGCPTIRGLGLHTVVFMLITWGMMNIKKEGYTIEQSINVSVGPSPEGVNIGPSPPPKMVEAPMPLPGFTEEQLNIFDSGLELASLDLVYEVDKPIVKGMVTCTCDNGSTVTIDN
jgi:hypothetical protein